MSWTHISSLAVGSFTSNIPQDDVGKDFVTITSGARASSPLSTFGDRAAGASIVANLKPCRS